MTETLFRKLLRRFAFLPIFCGCAFLLILGLQLREIAMRRLEGSKATTILIQSNRLQKSMLDEEVGVRGYLVAKDSAFLGPYRDAVGRFGGEMAVLRDLTSSNPSLTARVGTITESYKRYAEINLGLIESNAAGDTIAELIEQKQAADALRVEFADLDREQNDIREANRRKLTVLLGNLPAICIVGGTLIAALLLWYGMRLFREITAAYRQQLDETELQRDYLQTTLRSIGDAVLVCDDAGKITMLNSTAEEITGWTSAEAVGRPMGDVFRIIHEKTRLPVESPADKVRRLKTAVSLANHTVLIRRDGTEIPIDDSGAPIRSHDGGLSGVVLVFRSVAEQRRAAGLIRKNQELLNSIFNTSLEYIGILDLEGRVLECNRASLEFAGNRREDVVGRYFWECPWFLHSPGVSEVVQAAVERAVGGKPTRAEMELIRPSGETVNFDFSLAPVFDSEGKVIYLVPEARDISERKRTEVALMQSEKLAAVGRLASSIAHEINNPLEAVTNLLYLARNLSVSTEVEEYLKAADLELRRVSVITNQTLRFHKQASNPHPIQVADLFLTVLSIYEGRLRNSNILVEISHRTEEPIVCFAGDVRQVLNNLVGNAIDAMSKRGGRLLIRSKVSTDWLADRKGIVFTVADSGSGIARDDLSRIFEPFFTTKGIGGTGLGLWVSKEVVLRHEGTLKARSSDAPDRSGTVFRFFLPFA